MKIFEINELINYGDKNEHCSWIIYPYLKEIIKINSTDKILDAGCGDGRLSEYLNHKKLYAIDYDISNIKKAKKKKYKEVKAASVYNIPYPNKYFDKSFCVSVLIYVNNIDEAMKELMRVTKDEIIITVPNYKWWRIKSFFFRRYRKIRKNGLVEYNKHHKIKLNEKNISLSSGTLRGLAEKHNLDLEIMYLSNNFKTLRNLFGNWLASEVVGIFRKNAPTRIRTSITTSARLCSVR